MTLKEIAIDYEASAVPLRRRLKELRTALKTAEDPEEIWHLKRRIAELTPMLTECNKLSKLCKHYYDRGFYREEAYCFSKEYHKKSAGKYGSMDQKIYPSGYGEERPDLYSN